MPARPHSPAEIDLPSSDSSRRWLLLVHQIPAQPSNNRVRTWRRLQQVGAVPLKQSVYVLPDSSNAREDFEWLKAEIVAAGGDATILAANQIDGTADQELIDTFKRARQDDYLALARDVEAILKKAIARRRGRGQRAPAMRRLSGLFRQRLSSIESIDFFASAGRDRVISLIERLGNEAGAATTARARNDKAGSDHYRGRLWVTRPRPGVDRMASAWLIRRFIDQAAVFAFAADRTSVSADALPFDMFGVEFTHRDDHCTFETLCEVFGVRSAPVTRVGELVHDLDLKDGKYGAPDAPTVNAMIDGLQMTHADDHQLLERGIEMFESLYRSFERSKRPARPRAAASGKGAKRR
jgi:hypothetical protein